MTNKEYTVLADIRRHIKFFDTISLEPIDNGYICKLTRISQDRIGYEQYIFVSKKPYQALFRWKPELTKHLKEDGSEYTLEELNIKYPCENICADELFLNEIHTVCSLLNRLVDVGYYLEQKPETVINDKTTLKIRGDY